MPKRKFNCLPWHILLLVYRFCFQLVPTEGWENTYIKPNPSNKHCIESIERIQAMAETNFSSEGEFHPPLCLGCSKMTQDMCPTKIKCQKLIDTLYKSCDGVKLPSRYYYDPPVSLAYFYYYYYYYYYSWIKRQKLICKVINK